MTEGSRKRIKTRAIVRAILEYMKLPMIKSHVFFQRQNDFWIIMVCETAIIGIISYIL